MTNKEKAKAKKVIKKTLPNVVKLLNNQEVVKKLEKEGKKIDISAIFKLFVDAAEWKIDMNKVFSDARKVKNG